MHRLTHLDLGQFCALDSITLRHSMTKPKEIKYIPRGPSHSQDSIQEKLRNQCLSHFGILSFTVSEILETFENSGSDTVFNWDRIEANV